MATLTRFRPEPGKENNDMDVKRLRGTYRELQRLIWTRWSVLTHDDVAQLRAEQRAWLHRMEQVRDKPAPRLQ